MLADFFFFFIVQTDSYRQRSRISGIPLLAFLNRILDIVLAQLKSHEFQLQGTAVIRNGRDIVKRFLKPLVKEPLIGVLLDFNQVGHLQNLFLSCIRHTHNLSIGYRTYSVFLH